MPNVFTHELHTKLYSGKFSINTGLFIDGQFVDPVDKGTLEYVLNSYLNALSLTPLTV